MLPIAITRWPLLHRRALACVALLLAVVCLQGACKRAERADALRAPAKVVLRPENLATVERITLRSGPSISGTLEPEDKAVIRAEVGGSVLQVHADLSDRVARDSVLARIEVGGLRDAYRSAQAAQSAATQTLQVAHDQLERNKHLVASGAQPRNQVDNDRDAVSAAQARVEAARAQVATAGKQLRATTVRSPMAGVISERPVNQGDVVTPGAPLFTVIDPSSLRLEAAVPSAALPELALGTPVEFEVRGHPGERFHGEITRIAPAAEPATRQIPIQVSIPNPAALVLAGLFAEGRIASQQKQALALPLDAIDERGPRPLVTVVRDGRAQRVEVALGLVDEVAQRIEVSSGVAAGEPVVIGAASDVATGTPVQIAAGAPLASDGGTAPALRSGASSAGAGHGGRGASQP